MQFPFISLLVVWGYMYTASELRTFSHFHILKLLFPSIFCWYFRYFVSETYIFSGLQIHHAYIYNQCSSLLLAYLWCGAVCIYASERELRTFSHFHILKLLFPSIFCWYFRYFVSETYIYSQVSKYICIHIQLLQFPFIICGMGIYVNDSIPTKH